MSYTEKNLVREFKNNLDECNDKVHGLKIKLENNGKDVINKHCFRSRQNVYLAIENRKQELDRFGDEMFEKINQFESERIKFLGINSF